MIISLLVEGGNMAPGPALAQKLGPMGINMGKVISEVNKATASFKGIKVPVELDVDSSTKDFKIKIKSPPVAELIKKEIGLEKGAGDHKKVLVGNMAIEQVISVANTKLPEMLEKDLKAAVKTVIGSCVSLGILVENKPAKEIAKEVEEGKYDSEIKKIKIDVSPEKKKELQNFFEALSSKQKLLLEQEKATKEEAEKAKVVAPEAVVAPATGAGTKKPEAGKAVAKPVAKEVKKK